MSSLGIQCSFEIVFVSLCPPREPLCVSAMVFRLRVPKSSLGTPYAKPSCPYVLPVGLPLMASPWAPLWPPCGGLPMTSLWVTLASLWWSRYGLTVDLPMASLWPPCGLPVVSQCFPCACLAWPLLRWQRWATLAALALLLKTDFGSSAGVM